MRFWITKNSELPVREQLVRQVLLGILSDDLPAGRKLPSVRALARRHGIHANTVSAAYHDLLEQGWLELRRGSGVYVREAPAGTGDDPGLDALLGALLRSAGRLGCGPEEVLQRLERLVRPQSYERITVAEPDPAMRDILLAELSERLPVPVDAVSKAEALQPGVRTLLVSLPTRAPLVRLGMPPGVLFVVLRLNSVSASLSGETMPRKEMPVQVASRSVEFRHGARAMLLAVGLDPEALIEIDPSASGWQERIDRRALIVTDAAAARHLPSGCQPKVFRIVSDASLAELRQICAGQAVTPGESVTDPNR